MERFQIPLVYLHRSFVKLDIIVLHPDWSTKFPALLDHFAIRLE
jgi:hypothetical protein